jgi:hypothetical protein
MAHNPATAGRVFTPIRGQNEAQTASRKPASDALREACAPAAHALTAPIARVIALTALAALGSSGDPVHESVRPKTIPPESC